MNLAEREILQKIDQIVLNATGDELKKIQQIDLQTQLDGLSFHESYMNSKSITSQSIQQKSKKSRK